MNWRAHAIHTVGTAQEQVRLRHYRIGIRRCHRGGEAGGANLNPKPSVCILERGKERQPGEFPETLAGVVGEQRSSGNPLGLFELLTYPDISVMKGSGLGGTSLINANVAIEPDQEVFEQFQWPAAITLTN